jgi:hypothetical protein
VEGGIRTGSVWTRKKREKELQSSKNPHLEELERPVLTVKTRQPSHEFTFGVGMSFIPYPLVLTPVV